ncbi:MAG: histidine kinase dimerization/phospho-acceptor domain-containing protein, partial [bacterium]
MIELATRVFTADSVAALNQDDMAAAYQSALMTYLQDGTEEALMAAFTLARRALAVDLPVSDLAVFHADALRALPPNPAPDQGGCDRPMNFMVEFLSVYDMALQGYKKTVPLLTTEISERRRAEQQLRAATMELAFERDSLDAKVVARTRELGEKAAHLLATLDQLRQTNREQAEFTYAISHDLKSPSNTITMLIDELRLGYEHLLDGDAVELLELAQQTANRMRRLVDDVLSYSRCIETHPEHEPVYLDALVTEIVADLRYDIERTRAVLSFPVFPVLIGNRMQLKL